MKTNSDERDYSQAALVSVDIMATVLRGLIQQRFPSSYLSVGVGGIVV